ncbi:MAG: Nramp family divalent metal transporter, partial [Planctomycetes bacterium]|nr:Nramp family divalent metal transporter [Planctomycetota bacterium]
MMTRPPPRSIGGILRNLGPGLIVAGAIVGSGELIATTKTGAESGFWLLWLILVGCVIKVFAQVEFGRVTVTEGKTALEALDSVPGPRRRVNWIVWYWLIMTVVGLAQLGGIVGGVGQALALAVPLTDHGRAFNEVQERRIDAQVELAIMRRRGDVDAEKESKLERDRVAATEAARGQPDPVDPFAWAALLAIPTAVLLVLGRYKLVQLVSMVLVAAFTAVTVVTVCLLQLQPDWAISGGEIADGMSGSLPPSTGGLNPMHTALAAFGIIGVGAAELIMYPYWCLEKGYARQTGQDDGTDAWVERARGWLRVMRWDALLSM